MADLAAGRLGRGGRRLQLPGLRHRAVIPLLLFFVTSGPTAIVASAMPVIMPRLSGNHLTRVATGTM
jgi:hypothetical protein